MNSKMEITSKMMAINEDDIKNKEDDILKTIPLVCNTIHNGCYNVILGVILQSNTYLYNILPILPSKSNFLYFYQIFLSPPHK